LSPALAVEDAGAEVCIEKPGAPAAWTPARSGRGFGQLDELGALELTGLLDEARG
jgi:hypothetical protein